MEIKSFQTDAAAVAGAGQDILSGLNFISFPYKVRILGLKQPAGAVLANDADWNPWVQFKDTGYLFAAESLDPVNDGGVKLGPKGITIGANRVIQFFWQGQGAAQANILEVYFERM